MILLLSSLAPTVAYAPGLTLSLANACRTPPEVVPTSISPISSPRMDDASLATTKGLVLNQDQKASAADGTRLEGDLRAPLLGL